MCDHENVSFLTVVVNLGDTWEPPGKRSNIRMPRLHPNRPIKRESRGIGVFPGMGAFSVPGESDPWPS